MEEKLVEIKGGSQRNLTPTRSPLTRFVLEKDARRKNARVRPRLRTGPEPDWGGETAITKMENILGIQAE